MVCETPGMTDGGALRTSIAGPWGPILIAATRRGVVAIEWATTEAAFDAALARRLGGRVVPAVEAPADDPRHAHLLAATAAVEAALAGRPSPATVDFDLADRPPWDQHVLAAVGAIPWGRTASYGEIARRVGAPGAARAVGGAVGRNPISLLIPCHRVIAADGTLGGYGGDGWGSREDRLQVKRELLSREGVTVEASGG